MGGDAGARLRGRWWAVAGLAALGAGAGWVIDGDGPGAEPAWQGRAKITITDGDAGVARLDALAAAATDPVVLDEVGAGLGLASGPVLDEVAAEVVRDGVEVVVTSDDPGTARRTADEIGLAVVRQAEAAAVADHQARLDGLQLDADVLRLRITELGTKDGPIATAERDVLTADLAGVLDELGEAQRDGAAAHLSARPSAGAVDVSTPAPDDAGPLPRTAGAAAIGAAFGAAAALTIGRADTTVRGAEHAEAAFGVDVLASIAAGRRGGWPHGGVPASDEYRSVRAALGDGLGHDAARGAGRHRRTGSLRADGTVQVVLVASATAGDGRSRVAANLAAAYAEVGWSVVLVDAHHDRPAQHRHAGLERSPGLVDALAIDDLDDPEQADLAPFVRSTETDVAVVPAGGPIVNPAAAARRQRLVVRALRAWADVVVVDSPPLLAGVDAVELAGEADAVVLVARADHTEQASASRAAELLRRAEVPINGAVLLALP